MNDKHRAIAVFSYGVMCECVCVRVSLLSIEDDMGTLPMSVFVYGLKPSAHFACDMRDKYDEDAVQKSLRQRVYRWNNVGIAK